MLSISEEFEYLKKLIIKFDSEFSDGKISDSIIEKTQISLDRMAKKFQYEESAKSKRYMLYEMQALIDLSKGDKERAVEFVAEAKLFMEPGDSFISKSINKLNGSDEEVAQAEETEVAIKPKHREAAQPKKIAGWLALYAIRLIVSPIVLIVDLVSTAGTVAGDVAGLRGYMFAAERFDFLMAFFAVTIIYFFFSRERVTKSLVIAFEVILGVCYLIFYFWIHNIITTNGSVDDGSSAKLIIYSIVSFLWILYWLFSKRVKETFIR